MKEPRESRGKEGFLVTMDQRAYEETLEFLDLTIA